MRINHEEFVRASSKESMGGNAGKNIAVNAILHNGEIIFTNYSQRDYGKSSEFTLFIKSPPMTKVLEIAQSRGPMPPLGLIQEIKFTNQLSEEQKIIVHQAVVEYNRGLLNEYFSQKGANTNILQELNLQPVLA